MTFSSADNPTETASSGITGSGAKPADSRVVAVPSDLLLPVLFSAGQPHGSHSLDLVPEWDESEKIVALTIEFHDAGEGTTASLSVRDPTLVHQLGSGLKVGSPAWRAHVLTQLPRFLGPEAFVVYCLTWHGVDGGGHVTCSPSPLLKLLGLRPDSRAVARMDDRVSRLTKVHISIHRGRGPSTGSPKSGAVECPLVEESSLAPPLYRGLRTGSRTRHLVHPKQMLRLRRRYYVNIPLECFRLVGGPRVRGGPNEAGFRAAALCITAYIYARAFAGRRSRRAGAGGTFLGSEGYWLPLDQILTASGFTTAASLHDHRGREVERATATIDALRDDWHLFGPGSAVKLIEDVEQFHFAAPEALRKDLEAITEIEPAGGAL